MIRLVKLTATAVWFPCLVYALASAIARPVRVKPEPEPLPSWRDGLVEGSIGLSGIYDPDDPPTEDLYVPHHDRLAAVARWN